jgi:hypothetical protein
VVCITPSVESNPGSFVRREILYAQQQQKPLIPLVFPNSYLPTLVNHLTWIPFCSGKMPDQTLEFKGGFARLTERLAGKPTPPGFIRPISRLSDRPLRADRRLFGSDRILPHPAPGRGR